MINPNDVEITQYTTCTASLIPVAVTGIKIRHIPTGITVSKDTHRSVHANKHEAYEELLYKLGLYKEPVYCCICVKKAKWLQSTQFSGDHPYCKEHAKLESGFKKNDSYGFWTKIQRKVKSKE